MSELPGKIFTIDNIPVADDGSTYSGSKRDDQVNPVRGDLSRMQGTEGKGIAVALNLLNPEIILLGGGVMQAGTLILEPARQKARENSYSASFECCSIQIAALGNKAGFMGAALYARDHLFEQE